MPFKGRIYFLTAYVVHAWHKYMATYLLRHLSIYLVNSGMKQQVVQVLNRLGICSSPLAAQEELQEIARVAKAGNIVFSPHAL